MAGALGGVVCVRMCAAVSACAVCVRLSALRACRPPLVVIDVIVCTPRITACGDSHGRARHGACRQRCAPRGSHVRGTAPRGVCNDPRPRCNVLCCGAAW